MTHAGGGVYYEAPHPLPRRIALLGPRARIAPLAALVVTGVIGLLAAGAARAADPPVPSGGHPRLFMSPANVTAFAANVGMSSTLAAQMVADCQRTIDKPSDYTDRGGADAYTWPLSALSCAFAYVTTQQAKYMTPALLYWKASLNDDQKIGDGLGCSPANANFNWKAWNGNDPAPPNLLTVLHDTGYPIRWYGPFISLVYDWLYSAPGVDDALRTQTRTCLSGWIDYYSMKGYHHDEIASNYNAGFFLGKVLAGIAIGNDGGADGHLWTETLSTLFSSLMVGKGLTGSAGGVGTPAGPMVGGDWGEGWQYGPLSVLEYAVAARAVEEAGAAQPDVDAWVNSLVVRYIHGTVPSLDGIYVGNGDFDSEMIYQSPSAGVLDAVLAGPSSDQAAAWAASMKQLQSANQGGSFWNVLAELRKPAPQDYRMQSPAPPLWYLARGTRTMYVRTSWDASAFWGVFASAPKVNTDHQHFAASNFVFNRGGDALIVDPSNYGEPDTLETNAVTADSAALDGNYGKTQTPWSTADLPWARGTDAAVFAARSDFAHAFDGNSNPSDVPYAHREWVFLPEGEIVTVDRVRTGATTRNMYVSFHANTAGHLALSGNVASGTVGSGSAVAIHAVMLSGGTPMIIKPEVGSCSLSCSFPCGSCQAGRFANDDYTLAVPGPSAVAVHVIDGLAAGEAEAAVGSLNDDNFDPAPKQNAGVIGAAVYRGMKQSYVVASSAQNGAAPATMTYGVPGGSPARHIVYDAPEAGDGSSAVSASAASGRCVVSIAAGAGGGLTGHPLMFQVSAAGDGCKVTEDTNVAPGTPPPGGGVTPIPGTPGTGGIGGGNPGGGGQSASGGCSCALASAGGAGVSSAVLAVIIAALVVARPRRRRRRAR